MTNKLITYEWNGKKFTSQDRLNTLFMDGIIEREVIAHSNGYGTWYSFYRKDGQIISSFYKDSSFGFDTQATGIELKLVSTL